MMVYIYIYICPIVISVHAMLLKIQFGSISEHWKGHSHKQCMLALFMSMHFSVFRNYFSVDFYNTLFSVCSIYSFCISHWYFSHYIASLPLFYFACCMILWSAYFLCYLCWTIALAVTVICRLHPTLNTFYLIFYLCISSFSRSWRPELAMVTQFIVYSILANTRSLKLLLIYESNYKQCNKINKECGFDCNFFEMQVWYFIWIWALSWRNISVMKVGRSCFSQTPIIQI